MKSIIILTAILGFIIGSFLNISTYKQILDDQLYYSEEVFTTQQVSCDGAACDNMFSPSDNCKESTASCCEGGTGYNLTCTIRCDSQATINCGTEDSDPGQATLLPQPCFNAS